MAHLLKMKRLGLTFLADLVKKWKPGDGHFTLGQFAHPVPELSRERF